MADPINGSFLIEIDEKFMTARLSVTQPKNGGRPVTEAEVRQDMAMKGIRYNVDEEAFKAAFSDNSLSVQIANGDPPVDGRNGYLVYHFERKSGAQMKADEFGNVDFKDLGLIQNIKQNVIVADIFPETQGTPGRDIRGIQIPQYPGKPAKFSVGNGIAVTEDGKHLVTAISGNLRWNKDHFVVDKEIVVSGDVDLSVGNIDFIGDVIIKGNVNEGFFIKSAGNVSVAGNVTGATIEAEGNISGRLGFVSSNVTAKGDISVNFGENSVINCGGTLKAQSFIGCTVYCEGPMLVQGGKSVIVGGKYTCLSDIEVNYIGSDSYVRTQIILGNIAVLAEECGELKKKLKEYEAQLQQLELVCTTLQQQKKIAPLPPERDEMLKRSIKAKFGHMGLIKETHDRISDIEHEIENSNDLCVKLKRAVFPGVTFRINNSQFVVTTKSGPGTVAVNEDGDIVIR
ncbi:MAG: FapA family protein [Ruminiclostridium sp.]|nr:FapA family protein [Ruminiclostridium sp.]